MASTLYADTMLHAHTLKNGLQIVGQLMPDYESVALAYYVHTGSRNEHDPRLFGVSHFLEHMILKGSQAMNWGQLSQEFQSIGAVVNAFTSYEFTMYHARVMSEYLDQAMILLSALMHPRLDEHDFEGEKEVIVNEIARAEDQPYKLVHRHMMQAYFGKHPLGHDVLGIRESIRGMRLEQMRDYWQRRYTANNLILTIAGKFDWKQIVELAEQHCAHWRTGEVGHATDPYELPQSSTYATVNPKLNQQIMLIAMPSVNVYDHDYYAVQLACNVLGEKDSRLYWNIHQKGLVESIRANIWAFADTGILFVETNSSPQNAPQVLKLLYDELDSWLENGIEEDELRRSKNKWISNLVLDNESPFFRMRSLAADWAIESRLLSLDEEIERIETVTRKDIHRALGRFPMRTKRLLVSLGPLSENDLLSASGGKERETL
jgi:predicted Zn-dependent peptidase